MHRADFALTEGNGTIVGLKTGGHEDGAVWGFWAATGQRVKSVRLETFRQKTF